MSEYADLHPEEKPIKGGRVESPDVYRPKLKGKRFLFTVAQNNTKLHDRFWNALVRFAKAKKAQLCVSKLSYNKNGWQKVTTDADDVWYDERIQPYVINHQVKVCKGLVFCGELDILPTAAYPLNGMHNYSGENSAIVPHTKMHMQSLATMKGDTPKFLYSTGAVTLRNYIQRRAGQMAEYHHVYGALYVEVADDGTWFARQINADDDGSFYDLNKHVTPFAIKQVSGKNRPLVTLGDIHLEKLDQQAFLGALDMISTLQPEKVFLHDLIDFTGRNHHNIDDLHFLVEMEARGKAKVENLFAGCAKFLHALSTAFPDTEFVIVRSNHDEAFPRWVKARNKFHDPINAAFWHECNAVQLRAIEAGASLDIFEHCITQAGRALALPLQRVRFVKEDESVVIHGIEHGMHGHLGPNGSRAQPKSFRQIGRRANTGHTHSAGIIDGIYTGGVLGSLDMGYNKGPSSWSHSSIVTYGNGKRTIITQNGDKWKA